MNSNHITYEPASCNRQAGRGNRQAGRGVVLWSVTCGV